MNHYTVRIVKTICGYAFAAFVLFLAVQQMGCASALRAPGPCSTEALASHAAVCNARIRLECKPLADGSKDLNCPAFVACNAESIAEEDRCNAR